MVERMKEFEASQHDGTEEEIQGRVDMLTETQQKYTRLEADVAELRTELDKRVQRQTVSPLSAVTQ